MGEIADSILDGQFCEQCGEYLGEGNGFPQKCNSCSGKQKSKSVDQAVVMKTYLEKTYSIKTQHLNTNSLRLHIAAGKTDLFFW